MRTAAEQSAGTPRFKCSEEMLLRYHDADGQAYQATAQCLEVGETSVLVELEVELPEALHVSMEIPSQHLRRAGRVVSCTIDMGMFRAELDLDQGQSFDPIAITMYPLLRGAR